jgi:hypothetical protein
MIGRALAYTLDSAINKTIYPKGGQGWAYTVVTNDCKICLEEASAVQSYNLFLIQLNFSLHYSRLILQFVVKSHLNVFGENIFKKKLEL